MTQSKTKPNITRSKKESIVRVPYQVQQVEKETMDEETELIYEYNELNIADDGHDITDVDHWKTNVLDAINTDVQTYIYTRYDQGTQASFQAIDTRPTTPEEVRTTLNGLFTWIASVMNYYYTKKAEIVAAGDYSAITWDFSQFDDTDPQLSLSDYMGPA